MRMEIYSEIRKKIKNSGEKWGGVENFMYL